MYPIKCLKFSANDVLVFDSKYMVRVGIFSVDGSIDVLHVLLELKIVLPR